MSKSQLIDSLCLPHHCIRSQDLLRASFIVISVHLTPHVNDSQIILLGRIMTRKIIVAAAQLGAIHIDTPREDVISRMIALLVEAASKHTKIIVYPEIALTTFFPRFLFNDPTELDKFFEHGDDLTKSPHLAPLLSKASELKVDVHVGFAERAPDGVGFNSAIYYSGTRNKIISKFRKIHLPGTAEPFPNPEAINQLEKRYFSPGNLGFKAFRVPGLLPETLKVETAGGPPSRELEGKGDPILGIFICNDRRWPESWRVLALQGVELVLCGYNSPGFAPDLWGARKPIAPEEAEKESIYHHQLVMKANSYMNSCFSVCSARAGLDDGKYLLIGASCIVDSKGHIVAVAKGKDDELVVAEIDLEEARQNKENIFDFHRHRRPEAYDIICSQTGVLEPAWLSKDD